MPDDTDNPVILPHGGYRRLHTYQKAAIIFEGTMCFVRRFLEPGDRTVDQMVQAARSGKQNIIEGSQAAGLSKETELKLTGVARASLEELLEDYLDYLRTRELPLWEPDSRAAQKIRQLSLNPDGSFREYESYSTYATYLTTRSDGTCANILIGLIERCNYLLDRQLAHLEADFVKHGGIRERMTRARLEYRGKRPNEDLPEKTKK